MTEKTITEQILIPNSEVVHKLNTIFSTNFSTNVLIGDFQTCSNDNAEQIAKQLATLAVFVFEPVPMAAMEYLSSYPEATQYLLCSINLIEPDVIQIHFKTTDLLEKVRYLYAITNYIKQIDYHSAQFSSPSVFLPRMKALSYYQYYNLENSFQFIGPFGKTPFVIPKNKSNAVSDFYVSVESKELVKTFAEALKVIPLELKALFCGLPLCCVTSDSVHVFSTEITHPDRVTKAMLYFAKKITLRNSIFNTNQIAKMRYLCKKGAGMFATIRRACFLKEIIVEINVDQVAVNFIGITEEANKASALLIAAMKQLDTKTYECEIPLLKFNQIRGFDKMSEIVVLPERVQDGKVKSFVLVGKKHSNFDLFAKELKKSEIKTDSRKDSFYTMLKISSQRCIKAFEVEGLDQITYSFNNARIIYPRIDPFTCFSYYNPTLHLKLKCSIVPTAFCKEDVPKVLFATSTSAGFEEIDVNEIIQMSVLEPFDPLNVDKTTWFRISQNLYQNVFSNYQMTLENYLDLIKTINKAVVSPTLNMKIHAVVVVKTRDQIKPITSSISNVLVEMLAKHPEYIMHSAMKTWTFQPVTVAEYPYQPYCAKDIDTTTMTQAPAIVYRSLPQVTCGVLLDKNFKGITTGSFIPESQLIFRFDFKQIFGWYPDFFQFHAKNMMRLYMEPSVETGSGVISKDTECEMYSFIEKMLCVFNRMISDFAKETTDYEVARHILGQCGTVKHVYWDCYDPDLVDLIDQVGFSMLFHLTSIEVKFPDKMRNVIGFLFTEEKREEATRWVEADILVEKDDVYTNPYMFYAVKTPLHIIKYSVVPEKPKEEKK
ncbi:hypothetical protein EIN_371100 [Entamoeba invadens IP1]|uniref:Uncharacterized protein n=1 Tax=Entamoeba invadens IP1 TaxID=370355 RepID=A0A0A1UC51_ENTIV|nr:hypothetical protein EIN_371100 [Entamoeba invadens IP1]ELP92708.1 hypothetical protein EIN_371100 [Entamoeba invadens IP1]|eukprot:XP_004259479.1 hypothetical protein EIN_371100 [Entamoeba invadens IP1]